MRKELRITPAFYLKQVIIFRNSEGYTNSWPICQSWPDSWPIRDGNQGFDSVYLKFEMPFRYRNEDAW